MIPREVYQKYVDSQELRDFMSNVFKQVDVDKFMNIYKEAVQNNATSEGIYQELFNRSGEAKGGAFSKIRMGLNALKGERGTLADNVAKVMDPKRVKNGYVEIGMPGRMIKTLGFQGHITVVSDNEDIIQSGFPKPYHEFHKLTYDPLPVEENSVDVVSAFPGLHHCPEDKLDKFIESIHASLREGGIFLVREHDCVSELASLVHSCFNSASGVKPEEEKAEVRDFRSIEEWTTILEKKGFKRVSDPLIREGDTSLNGLLKFVKVGDDPVTVPREKLISKKPNYTRDRIGTHLTTVEWHNVESSQNLGSVKNFWEYPYFRDLKETWKAFGNSWNAARKVENFTNVAKSEYTVMNTVILVLMTIEYSLKGLLYMPFRAAAWINSYLPQGKTDKEWEKPSDYYQTWLKEYGQRLDVTPYYAQRYLPSIKQYWKNFATSWNSARADRGLLDMTFDRQTVKNVVTGIVMSVDLVARAVLASVINWSYGGEENGDDREIGVIVKRGDTYTGEVLPRYKELEEKLKAFAREGTEIVEIAGHTEIQIDLVVDKNSTAHKDNKLYERAYLPDDSKKIVALQVKVSDLKNYVLTDELHRVYDF